MVLVGSSVGRSVSLSMLFVWGVSVWANGFFGKVFLIPLDSKSELPHDESVRVVRIDMMDFKHMEAHKVCKKDKPLNKIIINERVEVQIRRRYFLMREFLDHLQWVYTRHLFQYKSLQSQHESQQNSS